MPLVIPVFIPHEGCPHSCLFCNQRRISGFREKPVTGNDVRRTVECWLARDKGRSSIIQVAFYGGSFTGLPHDRQVELLSAVAPFVQSGKVTTIRLSTRPDYIAEDTPRFLRQYYVGIVELGVQSMENEILAASGRGHTPDDVVKAMGYLHDSGIERGIQLMLGLPGETRKHIRSTVAKVITLAPDFVRIYPVLVVKNSGLASLYASGKFQPISLQEAVVLVAWMKKRFDQAHIRVVRMGLQAGRELEQSYIAGPWHPAFGEMVNSRLMLNRVRKLLVPVKAGNKVILSISSKDESTFRGVKSKNISRLQQLGLTERFTLCMDKNQQRHTVTLKL
jgi:histone acetyltransferase (RNA polymerase elongator complex component)